MRGIDLIVAPGEMVTLVGPSGCGKSTLLNMTAGLFGPSSGTVAYDGKPVVGINTRVGYMTQSDHLLPWRSVADNIAAPLQIAGMARAEIARRTDALIELVGLAGFARSYPSQLSGGMRKRAALARLLAYDPDTLLMDEPFGALDAQLRLRLQVELTPAVQAVQQDRAVRHPRSRRGGLARRPRCRLFWPPRDDHAHPARSRCRPTATSSACASTRTSRESAPALWETMAPALAAKDAE